MPYPLWTTLFVSPCLNLPPHLGEIYSLTLLDCMERLQHESCTCSEEHRALIGTIGTPKLRNKKLARKRVKNSLESTRTIIATNP